MLDEFDISEDELDIGIVEDDVAALEGLKGTLKDLGCHVVWAVKNDVEARKAIQEYVPRSVIVDLSLYVERPHTVFSHILHHIFDHLPNALQRCFRCG